MNQSNERKEWTGVSKDRIEEARAVDILDYLKRNEPHNLDEHGADAYKLKDHDSLKIYPSSGGGHAWTWYSRGISYKNALDFLEKVRGVEFKEAVKQLTPNFQEKGQPQFNNNQNEVTDPIPVKPIELASGSNAERVKEITAKLEDGIKNIFESDHYKTYLKTLSKFHNYSLGNTLLISMQKPDASYVAGFNAWKNDFKRVVKKGEKGIKIIAPAPQKVKEEVGKLDKDGKPVLDKDGKQEKEVKTTTVQRYTIATVFDVSQTDGEPLPKLGKSELVANVENYKDIFSAVEKSSPVPVGFEEISTGAKGYYHYSEKRIAINDGMSQLQSLKTLIHEVAHARVHDIDKNAPEDNRPDRRTREVEAESIAYTVCSRYGLDTSDYSFGYIANWSGDKQLEVLKSSLGVIRGEANAIIVEVDKHLGDISKEREQSAILGENQPSEQSTTEPNKPIQLPKFDWKTPDAERYLSENRAIDPEIIKHCIATGAIFQSEQYKNIVFVGREVAGDRDSPIKYASLKGTTPNPTTGKVFQQEAAGSKKDYPFVIPISPQYNDVSKPNNLSRQVNVSESAIDALSKATLDRQHETKGHLWNTVHRISLGGTSSKGLITYLEQNPHINRVVLNLDNDKAGMDAATKITEQLHTQYPNRFTVVNNPPSPDLKGRPTKDFNDTLVYQRNDRREARDKAAKKAGAKGADAPNSPNKGEPKMDIPEIPVPTR